MSLNIQNHIYSTNNIQSNKQRARAEHFVNKSDKEISHMAARSYQITHYKSEKKFNSRIRNSILSLPAIAVASSLVMKKGVKSAAKNGASWGLLVAIPSLVHSLGKAVSKPDSHGKKHDNMPFGLALGLSLTGIIAANSGLQMLAENKKVNKIADTIISGAKSTYKKVKKEINIPKDIKNKFAEIKGALKTPEFMKSAIDFAKGNALINNTKDGLVKIAKKSVKYAPELVMGGVLASVIVHAVKESNEISSNRRQLKDAQLNTARVLIDSYKQENEALKA